MEAFGKEMEAKFGAGSDFEKKMKDLGDDMKKKYGPGSEFAKNVKDKVDVDIKGKKKTGEKQSSAKAQAELDRAEAANRKTLTRERRIKKLEAQIRELVDEIKALKADDSEK
jgi:polyhydroxyalkanoate synthesis regulator phasin